ncbi:DUF1217 domain-containing protein [Agrobacterium sp. RAC06]|uniref:DUF1217 domain-containing protein n=1 Tax=Agrobacterium sp. RAC06 TaxID=1842536 RepID=UPI00083CD3D8|nr:DUF1217 domain-containing protein [Agrobacterium sp. RAC06]AOG08306.1 hypothetical protein BSY240_1736 [Agrobacterium sp. RAC06]
MVSTYLSYNLVNRDIKGSINRTASDPVVARQTEYFKENIGKVTNLEEFLDDYQLYSYAMKAHGLEEMTYAKAFMKKVLESDLSDEASFANQLTDERYRNFAASFQFSAEKTDLQTDSQQTILLERYEASLAAQSDTLEAEAFYYEAVIDNITSVSGLVNNSRLMTFALDAYGIDGNVYTKDHLTKVLTSDTSDPNSYVNQLVANGAANASKFLKLAEAFDFNADGSLSGATAQTAAQKEATVSLYVDEEQIYVTDYYRQRERAYYEQKIATITSVDELTADTRLFNYVKTAFELGSMGASTFKRIVTSDTSDPNSYAATNGGDAWVAIAGKFNFASDGTVESGMTAQGSTQLASTNSGFATFYDDADEERKEALTELFKTNISEAENVDDILTDTTMRLVLQRTFGFEANEFSVRELRQALTSDFTDPNSFANKSKDTRLIEMSKLFNFDGEGNAAVPLSPHNTLTATMIAKQYVINEVRFLDDNERTAAREAATKKAEVYQERIQSIDTVKELLADRDVIDVVIGAYGLDPEDVTDDFLKQVFASDLSDPKSFVNQQPDSRWAELVASFNFDANGNLTRETIGTVQQRGETLETVNKYLRQTLEETEGASNEAVRLALYFERTAPNITDAYGLIADDALMAVFRTTFGFSDEFSNMDVDQQARIINDNLDLADLQDPTKLERFLQRYTAMYDTENASFSNSAVSILSGGSGSISADLLFSLAQLKA